MSRFALWLSGVWITLSCAVALAQPGPGGGRGFGPTGGGPMQHPLMRLLDADNNGEISAEEISNAAAALKKLDKNGDGRLTRDELPMPGPGQPNREEMLNRLRSMDKDSDGKLGKEETPEWMQPNFSRLDRNGDGFLDMEELRQVAERMGGGAGGPGGPGGGRGGFGGPGGGQGGPGEPGGAGAPGRPEGQPGGNLVERMMNMDGNGDGKLSKEEAPERMQGMFERMDTNGDGFLDKEELTAATERLRDRARPKNE